MPHGGALESLAAVAAQLAAPLPLDRMAAVAADAAAEALGAPAVVIAVRDDEDGRLRPVHATGLPDDTWRRLPALLGDGGGDPLVLPLPPRRLSADERAYLAVLNALLTLALTRLRLSDRLRVGDLEIDLGEQRVVVDDHDTRLTPSELRLLRFLAQPPGRPRTRREILRHLWHTDEVVDERACDVHVSNLRRKIERDPAHPRRLVTVRSVGYALQCEGSLTIELT